MKTIRPDKREPIPIRTAPPRIGQVILRFGLLLMIASGLLLFAWLR